MAIYAAQTSARKAKSVQQPLGLHAEYPRKRRQALGVGQPGAFLPASDCLAGDAQLLGEPFLRPAAPGAESYEFFGKRHQKPRFSSISVT
mgnify:FL=1